VIPDPLPCPLRFLNRDLILTAHCFGFSLPFFHVYKVMTTIPKPPILPAIAAAGEAPPLPSLETAAYMPSGVRSFTTAYSEKEEVDTTAVPFDSVHGTAFQAELPSAARKQALGCSEVIAYGIVTTTG